MTPSVYLSPKLALTAAQGFALSWSKQPRYRRDWHMHDCAMLLWPQTGGLKTIWLDATSSAGAGRTMHLARTGALLLPASTAHHTRASTRSQRHGELYFAAERLGSRARFGALQLDGATVSLLDALVAPSLAPDAADSLVDAIVRQLSLGPSRALAPGHASPSLGRRMAECFAHALDWDLPLPQIDAVARELGVSSRQLQRTCQQEFGASPVDVRRHLLAARARALLAQGLPLSQVSRQLGFTSSGHLGRLLRALPG